MSSKPGDELGSEGKWFGDDCERNGLFGSTPPLFDELREDLKPKSREETSDLDQQFHKFEDDGKRPPVAMETASTGDAMSDLFRKPMSDDGELYTSLLSNQSYPSGQDASYLSDDLKRSSDHSSQDTFDSYGIFGSPHTKMTTDLVDEMPKSLLGSSELKTEAYNYMDISHGDDVHNLSCPQPAPLHSLVDTGLSGLDSLGGYMDKSPAGHEEEEEENLGPALDSHSFPYVEEPSEDEELSDYRSYRNLGTPQTASPVKIILTESHPPAAPKPILPQANVSDNILSLGLQGVPTVTLSEPEDDSPNSSPNASPTEKESPSRDLFTAVPSSKPTPGSTKASEQDGSSAESGDSEIELVSEEPPLRSPPSTKSSNNPFEQSPSSKGGFSQAGNPFDTPPSAKGPTSYSILREEREAELDSELFIESANEESPKREGSGPKQGVNTPSPLILTAASPASPAPELVPAEPVTSSMIKSSNEKSKSPMKMEEDRPTKPKPPMATVPPEVRSEKPLLDDKHITEGKGDLAKPAAPVFMEGFDKQKTIDLLYWRNVKQSGAVFGSVLLLLFSLTQFSVVSVGAYLALAALSASISFRIYKSVLQAVQKTDEGHPFKSYLEVEISLSQDQIGNYADKALLYANTCMKELRRLFLVQDLIDSLKFAVLMWLLTYVGALFNGLTLLILAVVSMFSMPIVYEKHQAQIDQYVGLIRTQVNSVVGKIQAKIPGAKRKEE
ncbi:reticulon-1 isoform X1 [Salmo salar]|uniref:Reticulon n=2 Tax=Salmo salar TaxID=8030 RepID=A0A1S3QYR0_SALSA|nr:reticulon-1 isoform X1 [Salmo salar]|eukprot:XP_014045041.1 PREDICTED: reticulon-1-like isoform X1 [Salmo salar]